DQPRPSSHGRRIASPHPGSGIASGLRMTSRSPVAALAPTLAPPAKPRLRPIVTSLARGASSATTAAESSGESLSTTISSSPSRAARRCCSRRRSEPRRKDAPARRLVSLPRRCASAPSPGLLLLAPARSDVEAELVVLHRLAVLPLHVEDGELLALAEVGRVL